MTEPQINVAGMPEFDALLDHIYEYGTASEGIIDRANAFARALLSRYGAQPAASATQVGTWEPDDPRWFIWNPGIVRDSFPAGTPIYVGQPAASAEPKNAVTVSQLEMLFESEDVDRQQPGYHWRKGWNAAIRRCMGIAYPMYAAPVAAQAPFIEHETLRRALSHLGIAAPVSNEELGADMARYTRRVVEAAAQAPSVPEGWVMVPVQPTEVMKAAGCRALGAIYGHYGAEQCWKAMLYAAPVAAQMADTARDAIEQRDIAIDMLARWCVAVSENGAGWDDWDEHYKDAAYRPGPLRSLLDAAIDAAMRKEGK